MSYELRLKKLKESWNEIQMLRTEQEKQRKVWQKAGERVRVIGQELPKKLDEFNKTMV